MGEREREGRTGKCGQLAICDLVTRVLAEVVYRENGRQKDHRGETSLALALCQEIEPAARVSCPGAHYWHDLESFVDCKQSGFQLEGLGKSSRWRRVSCLR